MGGTFGERLRRLRRDGEREAQPWRQVLDARRRRAGASAPALAEPPATTCPPTIGPPSNLTRGENEHGPFLAREEVLHLDARHGDWSLGEVAAADARAWSLLTGDAELAALDPAGAVYLDTETTGLAGGAGTYVYMIGLGTFRTGAFHLWQGFLEDPGGERALLAEVARRLAPAGGLVSFFGKAFDRHRLEDKMRVTGIAPPFAGRAHLDLYHPFQRLTKGRLPDGRLQTVERELAGLARPDDLPGALAPAAWFDYLAGRPHRLEGVFRHNRDDVLSLVTLAAYLGCALREERADGVPLAGCAAARARAIALSHLTARDRESALPWLDRALARCREAELPARDLELARADALRHLGRHADARLAYEGLAAAPEDRYTLPALVGLAKLCEHGERELAAALEACRRAEACAARGGSDARTVADLARRRERIERKLGR